MEHRLSTKIFHHSWGILVVKEGEGGRLGESVRKGKFAKKTFFQIMLNEILKSCKTDNC